MPHACANAPAGLPAIRVGLISDTHGLLRPEAEAFLRGSDFIVHAGDICSANVLEQLAQVAPVFAVRGNNDKGAWAEQLSETARIRAGALWLYVIHDLAQLDIKQAGEAIRVVVSGHSHKPLIAERNGVLFVNPGSAGPRRFRLPVTIGELLVQGREVSARTVELVA
ncbi:MAG: phosphodiesterase, family [Polaromonas sp.]|nr:phosphodiesterase, family [Polaromonas sp.]